MTSFVIDESQLERLSPETRRELMQLLKEDLRRVKTGFSDSDWDPEGEVSYPLSVEEARALIRGHAKASRETLRALCIDVEGDTGRADLKALVKATGAKKYTAIGDAVAEITQRLRRVTGNPDAWLLNWDPADWQWDEKKKTYTKGVYFVSGAAIHALREAFGIAK